MKKGNVKECKNSFALTLLLGALIFSFIFVTLFLSALLGYFILKSGVISSLTNETPTPYGVIVMITIISLILGAVISVTISKFPLKPVNKIISQMNRLASGDFKARLEIEEPLAKHPTIKEITDSFNKMAQELENTEMLRSDFINNFSHEFKTPIVSIAGFAKLLKRGNLTEEQRKEYINIIEEESLRLSAMATNVLNLTKFENQTILTDITEFNLSEQLRNSILSLEGKWTKKNINFELDFDEYYIKGNKDMLKHVWINLIDNAIKFSSVGSTVSININDESSQYTVSVINQGIEIAREQQSKIFKKFYQADESHTSEGNGIGLALVKNVTELHGGKVGVECKDGTTKFTVVLPKKQ
jgi:signal transduction histidine kinase